MVVGEAGIVVLGGVAAGMQSLCSEQRLRQLWELLVVPFMVLRQGCVRSKRKEK